MYPVVHVVHITVHKLQPSDISQPVTGRPDPFPGREGENQFQVDRVLSHEEKGRGYQWLTILEGFTQHEAEW